MTKILVIEDEEILRGEVVNWLQLEDYEAMGAEDGVAGVEAAFQHMPDLVLSDITMPRLDGYGVLLELRSNVSTAAIPFIFMTARASHEDIRQGMGLGADDYITKPFTRLELLGTIEARLKKKSAVVQSQRAEIEQLENALVEEHKQRMLKAKMVAMFSHDFRNPLAAIMSSSNLLRDYYERLDEQRRVVHFNRVEASVRQLMQMLDDMLVVSQMETGKLDCKLEPLDVGAFLQDVVNEFQAIHHETHLILFENRFPSVLMADPRLLRQITANLISNAIKYSPHGSEVRIILDRNNNDCILTIRDQGIGIPQADQDNLFETFKRGSNVGSVNGTGLGLAIVKQAVELHGGTIQLESHVGKGTRVMVTIPASD